jgi:hypothetical protein
MRKVFVIVALALALLGAIGAGAARSAVAGPEAAHTQMLAAGTPDTAVCGGSASTYCN